MKSFSVSAAAAVAVTMLASSDVGAQPAVQPAAPTPKTAAGPAAATKRNMVALTNSVIDACAAGKPDDSAVYTLGENIIRTSSGIDPAFAPFAGTPQAAAAGPAYFSKPKCPLYVVDFNVGSQHPAMPFYLHPHVPRPVGIYFPTDYLMSNCTKWASRVTYYKKAGTSFTQLKTVAFRALPFKGGAVVSVDTPGAICRLVPLERFEPFQSPTTGTVTYRLAAENFMLSQAADWGGLHVDANGNPVLVESSKQVTLAAVTEQPWGFDKAWLPKGVAAQLPGAKSP